MSLPPSPAVDPATALPSVLVVEEHDEMRSALRDWLLTSFPPLRLREARSMEEALTLAEQAQLDLIFVNLELPGTNGIEAARTLRRRYPRCRVVVMSVNDSVALRIAALEAGAEAFVAKRDLRIALHPIVATLMKQR
jgi:DNA-binding NarL/FixJ family response regulator